MGQAGRQDPNDKYDARNPGVKPYKGSTDSELEDEEHQRRMERFRGISAGAEGSVSGKPHILGSHLRGVKTGVSGYSSDSSDNRPAKPNAGFPTPKG